MSIDDVTGLTRDRLLGGRVALLQPASGYRAAIDPVLLAASIPARRGETVAELGTGVGAAALCLASRAPGVAVVGVERDGALAALAERNVADNGVADRVRIVCADVAEIRGPCDLARVGLAPCDRVMTNPPYLPPGRAAPARRGDPATVETGASLDDWVTAALALLRPGGALSLIHRADRLDDLFAALRGRAGAVQVFPLWPKPGRAARRVVVHAAKGARGPARLAPGLMLHRPDGRYTEEAEAVLRHGAPLPAAEEADRSCLSACRPSFRDRRQ